MSIMDLFRSPAPATAATNVPAATQPNLGATPGNAAAPAATTAALETPGETKSPLDNFADLWKTDPKDAAQPVPDQLFNIDPAKLQEAVAQTNFSQVITPELRQKIAAGGEEAVSALMDSMNKITQASFAHSTIATTKIVEQALDKMQAKYDARMQQLIKQNSISDSLRAENPLFSNPAVDPLLKALELQLTQKFPNATAADITQKAKDYLVGFAGAISPASSSTSQETTSAPGEYDWGNFLK